MPRTLYITTELPYFPGQAGVMAMHIRHLSSQGVTGVVGPRYPHQPEDALQQLRDTVACSHWWPEHPQPGPLPSSLQSKPEWGWMKLLPHWLKSQLLYRLAGVHRYSADALAWRRVLVNLAPKILEALHTKRWNAVLLSQSTSAIWLTCLPASLARCVYFHDIRSDYLRRAPHGFTRHDVRRIRREERLAARTAEATVFVSELDRQRACSLLQPTGPTAVAPLCLDLDYFSGKPPATDSAPVILFTGHLAHPPNVDAVVHFLTSIWPRIVTAAPDARCRIVGAHPAAAVATAVQQSAKVELVANAPDIRPYFREARVYVVPMRFGGGVRNKILEAWAMGVPVVSTTMGAEGISALDGQNCWLRDTPEEFAAQVTALLKKPPPVAVSEAGRRCVEQQHSPGKSSPHLAAALIGATDIKRRSAPRILYDLRWLQPGKVGGVEQMTSALLDELAGFDREFEYRILGTRYGGQRWHFPRGFKHTTVYTDGPAARRLAWRDTCIERLASDLGEPPLTSPEIRALEFYTRLDFTIVHGLPCYVHPDLRRFPSVVTMHDLQHLHLPENFTPEDIATREKEYRESCRQADRVICISEFTRQDVHQRYGIPLDKLTTIWNLPPHPPAVRSTDKATGTLLARMGIASPYFYYPAQPWRHKNHTSLLKAMVLLDNRLPPGVKLVLTGQPFPVDHPAKPLLQDNLLRNRVVHLGYRSPAEVGALYQGAIAMVFPSLFEGFGLPILEAMQRRCPVACGTHTSLPEVAGDAAYFVDSLTPDSLAEVMLRMFSDPVLGTSLREKGILNLRRFDRRSLAEKTRTIYAAIHAEHFQ